MHNNKGPKQKEQNKEIINGKIFIEKNVDTLIMEDVYFILQKIASEIERIDGRIEFLHGLNKSKDD